jgi:hypothetical protein
MHEVVDVFRVDSDYENAVAFLDLNVVIVIIVVMNVYEVREILWKAV